MSLQLIHKYYQFLLEYKSELDNNNHTAFSALRKKHRINATTQSILIQHGIIAGKKGKLKWVKGNVSTEMAERLIEELRRKSKSTQAKRREVAKTDENEIIRSNNEKRTPKMRKPPKQQTGFTPIKPLKLKDWQEFVLVYIISAIISYLIIAFVKMDANLIQWNLFYRALIGFFSPTFILTIWMKSKSK